VRELADSERIAHFMRALGRSADMEGVCYLTGGATAVLYGWRDSTIDVDIRLVPETERLLRAIQELKDELQINVELASPADFIPVQPGWKGRSVFVAREGRLSFWTRSPTSRGSNRSSIAFRQSTRARSDGGLRRSSAQRVVRPLRARSAPAGAP